MIPDTVFNSRRLVWAVCFFVIALPFVFAEPLASLVTAHKLNCAECIDNTRVSLWVSNRATADKLSPQATSCVSQNVIVTLYKTPEANQLREFYKQAVATCSKQ